MQLGFLMSRALGNRRKKLPPSRGSGTQEESGWVLQLGNEGPAPTLEEFSVESPTRPAAVAVQGLEAAELLSKTVSRRRRSSTGDAS